MSCRIAVNDHYNRAHWRNPHEHKPKPLKVRAPDGTIHEASYRTCWHFMVDGQWRAVVDGWERV